MTKPELKTKATGMGVAAFLEKIADEDRRQDCVSLIALMKDATGAPPRMWGPSIIGFGDVHLKYATGRELDWFVCGFAPRKDSLALYGLRGEGPAAEKLLGKLGKHKAGKGCLYVKKLADIDLAVMRELLERAAGGGKKVGKKRTSPGV
jgi:hypothetical protein